jgi:hypothetical protein
MSKSRKNLSIQERRGFVEKFNVDLGKYDSFFSEQLLNKINTIVSVETKNNIQEAFIAGVITAEDLKTILAYVDFIRKEGMLGTDELLPLDIRQEERFLYILVPVENSLIGSINNTQLSWSHDDEWANNRFFKNTSKNYLCGQRKGSSKFATVASPIELKSSKQARIALGLEGYCVFSDNLHIVSITPTEEIQNLSKPKVPIGYNVRQNDDSWERVDNFLEGTVPGFTSGGFGEVVINTFEIQANSLSDLKSKGVRIRTLE